MPSTKTVTMRTTLCDRSVLTYGFPNPSTCTAAEVCIAIGPWKKNWTFFVGPYSQGHSRLRLFESVLLAIPFVRLTLRLSFALPEPPTMPEGYTFKPAILSDPSH